MSNDEDYHIESSYRGNALLKAPNEPIEWTPHMIDEYMKCSNDPLYFVETYMKVIHADHGLVNIKPYDYQREMLNAMWKNRNCIFATCRQAGKALPLDIKIPTPTGWKTMGELSVGDVVFGSDGQATKVMATSPIFTNHDCYKITFDDGTSVVADGNHKWHVRTIYRQHKVKTTEEMFTEGVLRINARGYSESKWSIKNCDPVQYSTSPVPIDPYLLGMWLGDGTSDSGQLTCHADDLPFYKREVSEHVFSHSYNKQKRHIFTGTLFGLGKKLRAIGLLKNKHIPNNYMFNSVENRIALLQGLMDTDGWVDHTGQNCIALSLSRYPQLIDDVYQLLVSLGLKVFRKNFPSTNSVRLYFSCARDQIELFRLPRKREQQKTESKRKGYTNSRFIRTIEKVQSVPTKCITVEASNHLFLCSEHFIPTHNSTITCAFILWYILFTADKTVALLANKAETAREILSKVTLAYQHLPKWLQQGVVTWNKGKIELENNSRVIAAATSSDSIRGYTINFLFIDEAAHIENWDEFFTSTFPTVSSGKTTKVTLVSTPLGLNHFHKLWVESIEGRNDYKRVMVTWKDVPGRDEAWKAQTLGAMGNDYEKFSQEHEVEFLGSSGTLIAGWKLKELVHRTPMIQKEGMYIYEQPIPGHIYCITVDSSEGKGLDYSCFQVIDVSTMPYKQVCTFRNNMIVPWEYAETVFRTAKHYNTALMLVEVNNSMGNEVSGLLMNEFEYENMIFTESAGRAGKRITSKGGKNVDRGLMTTKKTKAMGCSMLKLLIEQNMLIVIDNNTIGELARFSRKNDSYEAEEGAHDDTVMCLVLFGWLSEQQYFKEVTDINTLQRLRDKSDEDLEYDMLPFGFVEDGRHVWEETTSPVIRDVPNMDSWFKTEEF